MKKKVRYSNMELLRIVAMFLVLLVHADFFSLGAPEVTDCMNDTFNTALKVYFEAVSIACVDIFVCLSGWFGIKASFRGFSNFVFQCLFWLIGLYIATLLLGLSKISVDGIKGCFALTKLNWFIKAYALLYILSPVLNVFAETANKKLFKQVLISFFIFELIYGWIFSGSTEHIQAGYSTISFVGLYLLVRFINIHKPTISMFPKSYYAYYIVISPILITIAYVTPPILGIKTIDLGMLWINYLSPYCISYALAMILYFSKLNIQNKCINWIAASSFAVFLLHTNPNIVWHYKDFFLSLYNRLDGMPYWFITFGILLLVFIVALLIDQLRIIIWAYFYNNFLYKYDKN